MAKMPHSEKWRQSLSVTYNDQKAKDLVSRAKFLYADYCARHFTEMS